MGGSGKGKREGGSGKREAKKTGLGWADDL